MASATNRRILLGAIVAAGAVAARPAVAAESPTPSAHDNRVLDLWRQRAELKAISDSIYEQFNAACEQLEEWTRSSADHKRQEKAERKRLRIDDLGRRCDASTQAFCDVEAKFEEYMETSVLGLGAVLIIAIHDRAEEVPCLNRAALKAIRPQLVGPIAEAADRVLTEDEEVA